MSDPSSQEVLGHGHPYSREPIEKGKGGKKSRAKLKNLDEVKIMSYAALISITCTNQSHIVLKSFDGSWLITQQGNFTYQSCSFFPLRFSSTCQVFFIILSFTQKYNARLPQRWMLSFKWKGPLTKYVILLNHDYQQDNTRTLSSFCSINGRTSPNH